MLAPAQRSATFAVEPREHLGTEVMSIDHLAFEIARLSDYAEQYETFQRVAAERAGLQAPPSRDQMLPVEILLRLVAVQGDRFEAAIARRLTAARARQLRERNQGWPGDPFEWEGCPSRSVGE